MRKIVIGDIHGCYKEFIKLLEKIKFNKDQDQLIILGDLIDKGPDTGLLLDYLIDIKTSMQDNLILVKGNHELEFLYNGFNPFKRFILFCRGRNKTIKSINKNINYYKEWLNNNLVNYYEDELFQCTHANIVKESIKDNKEYTLTISRFGALFNKYDGKLTLLGHLALKEPIYLNKGKKEVLLYDEDYNLPKKGLIILDTACVHDGKLTAMVIENDKYKLFSQTKEN